MLSFEQPLAIAISMLCVMMIVVVVTRYGRQAQGVAFLLGATALLGLLLARPQIQLASDRAPNVIVVDVSASSRPALEARLWPEVRTRLTRLHANQTRAADSVVFFVDGEVVDSYRSAPGEALVLPEKLPEGRHPLGSRPWSLADILGPEGELSSLILISDGAFPHENVLLTLDRLSIPFEQQRLDTLNLPIQSFDGARLTEVRSPTHVAPGSGVLAQVVVSGDLNGPGELIAQASDPARPEQRFQPVSMRLEMIAKQVSAPIPMRLPPDWFEQSGWRDISFTVNALKGTRQGQPASVIDELPENNQRSVAIRVGERLPMLYVRGAGVLPDADPLLALLRASGHVVETIAPADLPQSPTALANYQCLVLNDVPAEALSANAASALVEAVESWGVPTAVFGAANAFGPGGYRGGRLEELLPLHSDPTPDRTQHHALLLDASDSMGEPFGSATGFTYLQRAAEVYLSALGERDRVEITPFNQELVDLGGPRSMLPAARNALLNALSEVEPKGRTSILKPLRHARRFIEEHAPADQGVDEADPDSDPDSDQSARAPRVVMISDGRATADEPSALDAPVSELADALRQQAAHFTLVLVGETPPAWFMRLKSQAAPEGRVDLLAVDELQSIDRLLARRLLDERSAAWWQEGPHDAALTDAAGDGLAGTSFAVQRYVATALKDGATLLAEESLDPETSGESANTPTALPLLARWEYGEGRVLAAPIACDGANSSLNLRSSLALALTGQFEWLLSRPPRRAISVSVDDAKGDMQVTLHWRDGASEARQAEFFANVLNRQGNAVRALAFRRRSPTTFVGMLQGPISGVVTLRIQGTIFAKDTDPEGSDPLADEADAASEGYDAHSSTSVSIHEDLRVALPPADEYSPAFQSWRDFSTFIQKHGELLEANSVMPAMNSGAGSKGLHVQLALLMTLIACTAVAIWLRRPVHRRE